MYVMYDLTSMSHAFTDILSYVFIHSMQFALKLINWICNQTKQNKTKLTLHKLHYTSTEYSLDVFYTELTTF